MFALTRGEIAIAAFIFALVWGARFLPRLGEHLGVRLSHRRRGAGRGTATPSLPDKSASERG
jgi:Sec-independent protein translocase protein TatA